MSDFRITVREQGSDLDANDIAEILTDFISFMQMDLMVVNVTMACGESKLIDLSEDGRVVN